MATKAKAGPGRAQRKGRSAQGRATGKGSSQRVGAKVGRPKSAEETGRYTRPIPRNARHSPLWFGAAMLATLVIGVLMILLNYLAVLPGGVSVWYLVGGIVLIAVGVMMATRYR